MENILNLQFLFISLAILLMLVSYYPYLKDILSKKTKPHIFTWVIWLITQGVASFAALSGGSIYSSIGLFAGTFMVLIIVLLSLKYGTKDIRKIDIITLFAAFVAIYLWLGLENLLLSVVFVSIIDGLGYIPSFRKTFADPSSETLSFWVLISLSTLLTLLANTEFNLLTSLYLSVLLISNLVMSSIIFYKKI